MQQYCSDQRNSYASISIYQLNRSILIQPSCQACFFVPFTLFCAFVAPNTDLLGFSVKTLLRYGANPDLRDEDGRTPLDKARAQGDEGHRKVMQILQSPGECLVQLRETAARRTSESDPGVAKESSVDQDEVDLHQEPKGDPEMAPVYLLRLLPVFTQVYLKTMIASVRYDQDSVLAFVNSLVKP